MTTKNTDSTCACEKTTCCCAQPTGQRCRCGDDCRCEAQCKCGGGCDCGCAKR